MIISLLIACAPTALTVGTPVATDDTAITDDTGETPDPFFAAGDFSGSLGWYMPDYDWEICAERFDFEVDEEGVLSGSGSCEYEGQQNVYDLEIELTGTFDEDGDLEDGEISFDTFIYTNNWDVDTVTAELEGTVDEDGDLQLEWETQVEMGNDGDLDVIGWAEGELD
jgi:hypothetical protein